MLSILYYKDGYGRRIRHATPAEVVGLEHVSDGLYSALSGGNPPANTTPPSITGSTTVGSTLTATPGTYTNSPTVTGQWQANATNIPGETGLTLDTTGLLASDNIQYVETATNAFGAINTSSNTVTLT